MNATALHRSSRPAVRRHLAPRPLTPAMIEALQALAKYPSLIHYKAGYAWNGHGPFHHRGTIETLQRKAACRLENSGNQTFAYITREGREALAEALENQIHFTEGGL